MKLVETRQFDDITIMKFGSSLTGMPKMYSYVYFVDGLLIDTGHSRMRSAVIETVRDLPVRQIFVTHHHEDHTGNLAQLQELFGVPTLASAECKDMMADPPSISFAQWISWGPRSANLDITACGPEVKTNNYSFEVIAVPGHARDMVALYEPSRQWLFSADLWVYHRIKYFIKRESVMQQIQSLQKVVKLEIRALLCGHNPQFDGISAKLQKKLDFFQHFYDEVAAAHHQGLSVRQIMKRIGLKETWGIRLLSHGELSARNMVRSVIRDEQAINKN